MPKRISEKKVSYIKDPLIDPYEITIEIDQYVLHYNGAVMGYYTNFESLLKDVAKYLYLERNHRSSHTIHTYIEAYKEILWTISGLLKKEEK